MTDIEIAYAPTSTADRRLHAAALHRLSSGTGMPPGAVTITVVAGRVMLTGAVDYAFQRLAATSQLAGLTDVCDVENRLTIRTPTGRTMWDEYHGRDCALETPAPFMLSPAAPRNRS